MKAAEFRETLPARRQRDYNCPIRNVVDRIGDAWSLLILLQLEEGPSRFNALRRQVDGVSQRMLTVTLRNLERDGLVSRAVLPSTPPQVEYSLTALGRSLTEQVSALQDWAGRNQPKINRARADYDKRAAREETTLIKVRLG